MEIFIVWLVLAFLVGFAASSRGRSGARWFLLAVIILPLIAILFVLALPNLKHQELLARMAKPEPRLLTRAGLGGKSTRVDVDRTPRPFEPDGVLCWRSVSGRVGRIDRRDHERCDGKIPGFRQIHWRDGLRSITVTWPAAGDVAEGRRPPQFTCRFQLALVTSA